jgi:guanylate kinase
VPSAKVFVITGPSGVGKGTLIRGLLERVPELELSVSATTRSPRPGEHAEYSGNHYGTLRSELERRLDAGVPLVLEIEVQGARQVREALPGAVAVFIAPPSRDALRVRLVGRGTDAPEQVDERLRTADREFESQPEFGHVVVNDRLEDATAELVAIVRGALGSASG